MSQLIGTHWLTGGNATPPMRTAAHYGFSIRQKSNSTWTRRSLGDFTRLIQAAWRKNSFDGDMDTMIGGMTGTRAVRMAMQKDSLLGTSRDESATFDLPQAVSPPAVEIRNPTQQRSKLSPWPCLRNISMPDLRGTKTLHGLVPS